jgi:hypothetical protein
LATAALAVTLALWSGDVDPAAACRVSAQTSSGASALPGVSVPAGADTPPVYKPNPQDPCDVENNPFWSEFAAWQERQRQKAGGVLPPAPRSTSPPTILGTPRDGETLTVSSGFYESTGPYATVNQWYRCDGAGNGCEEITGAKGRSYTLTSAEVGHTIRVTEMAANAGGWSAPVWSAATGVVAPAPPSNTRPPTAAGVPAEGQTLIALGDEWRGTPPMSFSYQWLRCDADGAGCAAIPGATAQGYTATADDGNHALRVRETAANAQGTASADSAPTEPVVAEVPDDVQQNPTATPSPPSATDPDDDNDVGSEEIGPEDFSSGERDEGGSTLPAPLFSAVKNGDLTLEQAFAESDSLSCVGDPFHRIKHRSSGGWRIRFGGKSICTEITSMRGVAHLENPNGNLVAAGRAFNRRAITGVSRGVFVESKRVSRLVFYKTTYFAPPGQVWAVETPGCSGVDTTVLDCEDFSRVFR